MYPVPRHRVAEIGEQWAEPGQIVGNGPYQLTGWSSGRAASLVRNPHYHGVYGGNVNRVDVLVTDSTDDSTDGRERAMRHFSRGNLDVLEVTDYPGNALRAARAQYGENYLTISYGDTRAVAFNSRIPPLDDVRLRRALAMAIDKDLLVQSLVMEQANPAHGGWVPPGLPGHSPGAGLPFKPDEARLLLAEAGYPEGRGLPELEMVWDDIPSSVEQSHSIARIWQEQLGVTVRPLHLPPFEWAARITSEQPAIAYVGWAADFPDPENFLRRQFFTKQGHERFLALIDAAGTTIDQQERLDLYRQADKLLIDEALIIPLYYGMGHYLVSSRVRKFPTTLRWRDIIIDS
jgi:oligopeptide transport system substrate-binding protein